MMQKLQNRKTAVLISLIVVLFSFLLGSARSLRELRDEASYVYYMDTQQIQIADDLYDAAQLAENLMTISERYLEPDAATRKALRKAIDRIYEANGPHAMFVAAQEMRSAMADMHTQLGAYNLSEMDRTYQEGIQADVHSLYLIVERSEYNRVAQEFNEKLQPFPANILAAVAGIEPLELYA